MTVPIPRVAPDPYPLIDAAERPLIWAGAGARDRADEVSALAERLAAPVLTTYGARGVLPPEHPCNVGMPPHVEPAGRLWDEADLVIAFGSDLDGMNTQNWLQPQPPQRRRRQRRPRRRGARTTASTWSWTSSTSTRIRQRDGDVAARTPRVRAEACRDLDPRALRFLDAISYALPDDANVVCDMCIPGYWIAGFHGFHHPRKLQYPMGWGTLGFAFPAALGAVARRHRPDRLDLGRRRLPVRLRRARHDGAGAAPVHRGDRRRRRLRDAALRPAARRRRRPTASTSRRPTSRRWPRASACAPRPSTGSTTRSARRSRAHVADGGPSVLVAKAEALIPPPTTSPNWYRKRR